MTLTQKITEIVLGTILLGISGYMLLMLAYVFGQ